jgi:hypothetical protein
MQKLVKRNYIHTLEYSARSRLYGDTLKALGGRGGVYGLKTFSNNPDAALTLRRNTKC